MAKAKVNKKKGKKKSTTGTAQPRRGTKDPYNFPKVALDDTIRLAQAIEEKFAGHPTPAEELVKAVGLHKASDWRFQDLLRSGEFFGLTRGTGAKTRVSLTELGLSVVAPGTAKERQKALLDAFNAVGLFEAVNSHYKGRVLPDDEFVENTLMRDFGIPKERTALFKDVFQKSQDYLRDFEAIDSPSASETVSGESPPESQSTPPAKGKASASGPRKYLDDCFVIMPFGEWFDRYYTEIYAPAIKEAGYEPRRADELFSTGTVIEQIYAEIKKAKLLIAELTGKNANVFYELGLSHARGKPVIFITSSLDDVPFDLRHLRIICYDVREPKWAEKLFEDIKQYIINAREEPEKSIPQPFRDEASHSAFSGATPKR